jgi:hypothetical protein
VHQGLTPIARLGQSWNNLSGDKGDGQRNRYPALRPRRIDVCAVRAITYSWPEGRLRGTFVIQRVQRFTDRRSKT